MSVYNVNSYPTILSVSYDAALDETRARLLELHGYAVIPAHSVADALTHCKDEERIDLLLVGHAIPHGEKENTIAAFRASRPAVPVIALKGAGEQAVHVADLLIERDPGVLLASIATLVPATPIAA